MRQQDAICVYLKSGWIVTLLGQPCLPRRGIWAGGHGARVSSMGVPCGWWLFLLPRAGCLPLSSCGSWGFGTRACPCQRRVSVRCAGGPRPDCCLLTWGIHKATVKVIAFLPPQHSFSPLPITHRGQFNKRVLRHKVSSCGHGASLARVEPRTELGGWRREEGVGWGHTGLSPPRPALRGGSGRASFLLPLIIYCACSKWQALCRCFPVNPPDIYKVPTLPLFCG